jgi:N-acetylmuramoyl-L-alanine amidase
MSSAERMKSAATDIVRLVVGVAVVLCLSVSTIAAAPTAQDLYMAALAREEAVRPGIESPDAPETTLADVRSVVAAYQEIARLYPASGYTDNALWQAGVLSIDAFLRFNEPRDRTAAVSLLRQLTDGYPSSSLVKDVRAQLARVGADNTTSPQAPKIATITRIRRDALGDTVRVTIELDHEVSFHEERIDDPVRVFVDMSATRPSPALRDKTLRFDDGNQIHQIRIGRHPNDVTRVVLDAIGVASYSIYPLYNPYRIVIDCVREPKPLLVRLQQPPAPLRSAVPAAILAARRTPVDTDWSPDALLSAARTPIAARPSVVSTSTARTAPAPRSSPLPVPAAAPRSPSTPRAPSSGVTAVSAPAPPLPGRRLSAPALIPPLRVPETAALPGSDADGSATRPLAARSLPAATATTAPPRNAAGGYSMARQLGLNVSRIVIDPGHGGHDPGAKGRSVDEAELVLDIALRVEKLLQNTPGIEVILTRRGDEYVSLQERTVIANREGADLFLSIHANASSVAAARGVETYFLNFASNMSAAAVAARENAASGEAMGALPGYLKAIALNNKLDESREFATDVQGALVDRLRKSNRTLKDLGVKQAPFVVLIGAAMPSVLTEISFVTNGEEAKLLRTEAYRDRIAEALVNGVRKYQMSLKSTTAAARSAPREASASQRAGDEDDQADR